MIRSLLTLLVAVSAAASVELGPASTVAGSLGRCANPSERCLAVAGNELGYLLVWPERSAGKVRLRSSNGSAVFDIYEGSSSDKPSIAFDGQSYLAVWRTGGDSLSSIHIARLSAAGALVGNRMTIDRNSATAQVVWNGLEFAVVLPRATVSLSNGSETRSIAFDEGREPSQVVAAVSGNSILAVRELRRPIRCSGFSMFNCWGGDYFAASTFVGSKAHAQEVLTNDRIQRGSFALAAAGDGYLLVWSEHNTLRSLRLDAKGRAVGEWNLIARLRTAGTSTVLPTREGWVVAWDDRRPDGSADVYVRELDANGMVAGAAVNVASDALSPAMLAIGADRFRLFYRTDDAIESRLLVTGDETLVPPRRRSVR